MWVLEIIAILALGLVLYRFPAARPAALISFAVLGVGLVAVLLFQEQRDRDGAADIPLDLVSIEGFRLQPGYRNSYSISGRVHNGSRTRSMESLTLTVRLYDCPTPSPGENCVIIGEDRAILPVNIPPGQTRALHGEVAYYDLPEIEGQRVWDYEITAVRARK